MLSERENWRQFPKIPENPKTGLPVFSGIDGNTVMHLFGNVREIAFDGRSKNSTVLARSETGAPLKKTPLSYIGEVEIGNWLGGKPGNQGNIFSGFSGSVTPLANWEDWGRVGGAAE